jgi:NADH-quinone oxidoreductase E subunit
MNGSSTTDNRQKVMTDARALLNDEINALIDQARQTDQPESRLISILHKVQSDFGYLPQPQMDAVAQLLRVPASTVSGVATFYHFFRLQPQGQFAISVCMGTACYVRGADRLVERLQQELGIEFGETTSDGQFSLEESRCLGTCGLAPVVMINGEIHGKVTPDQVPELLNNCRRQSK